MAHCSQSSIFPKIVEIERLPLRAAVVLVSNLPRGQATGFIAVGKEGKKISSLELESVVIVVVVVEVVAVAVVVVG